MKNRRIPGFPLPEDQDTLQFYVLKSLSYTTRVLLYIGCIAVGFIIQIFTVSLWPGALLLIFAALINLVKGYNSKPTRVSKNNEDSWTKTSMDKVQQINQIKEKLNKWDRDAMDISNGMGCMFFGVVTVVLIIVFSILASQIGFVVSAIFIVDSFILILSLWFNGMRIKGHQGNLYIKTDIIIEMKKHFDKLKKEGENFIPSLMLAKDKEDKDFPIDCRFNITFDNTPADFYGIQAQININSVEASNYPFFYCVITAKTGFGLGNFTKRVDIPKSIVVQYSEDSEAEVIVVRQHTTKSSGYHTKMNTCKSIFEITLALARIILEEKV